ncbi:MAG TPA: hypothetical protein VN963_03680 [bacterium]|nr:hypothetical protein [bacterium]
MKLKKSLFLFSLSLLMFSQMAYLKVQAADTSNVILQQQLTVPGPNQQPAGQKGQGVYVPFTLNQLSTVTLTITANQSTPTLNVYLLYPDNYSVYKGTGSLTNATPLKPFTALNTLSYQATGVLNTLNYGLVIQQDQTNANAASVTVGVEIDAQKYTPPPAN